MGKNREREWRGRDDRMTSRDEPLVIDLPEGQKLYVGRLDDGMAIEVATWRGVGEPDSRVARMIIAANRDGSPEASARTPSPLVAQQWGARAGAGTSTGESGPQVAGASVEADSENNESRGSRALLIARRAASLVVGVPLSVATAAVLAGWIVIAKPIPSLATELELGNSGVIVAATAPNYEVGDEVLARVSANSNQAAVVATVLEAGGGKVTIATNGKPVVLEASQIMGRLVTTLPIGAEAIDRPLLAGAMIAALFIGILVFAL